MNLLSDILTYIRRIIKSPNNNVISDDLLIDYVNRFWLMDVDARIQLFDLKTKYQFLTTPGVDSYNMPMYDLQIETGLPNQPNQQEIALFPVYQGFMGPAYVNGVPVSFETQKSVFYNLFPKIVQNFQAVAVGDGSAGPYTINIPILPQTPPQNPPINGLLRGHVDITGIVDSGFNIDPPLVSAAEIANVVPFIENIRTTSVDSMVYISSIAADKSNVVVCDSGQFMESNQNYGLLMVPGKAPYGNISLNYSDTDVTVDTINYLTGQAIVTFPVAIPAGNNINVSCYFFSSGLPRGILYYNNTLTLRAPPATQYIVELDAYLTPAAFLNTTGSLPFGYMAEYIARGAARKILSDTGDVEQFQFYEPLFREQEMLVWKRSQRQFTATRTETIYSNSGFNVNYNQSSMGI